MTQLMKKLFFIITSLLSALFVSNSFAEEMAKFNMTPGVTPISQDIYYLHMTIFWICVGIAVVVFSVMFYALFRHRKSKNHQAATFHEHNRLEIFWAIIPLLILVIMAIPATKVLMRMYDDSEAAVNIKVIGYQWKWQYEYLDEGISFYSNLSTPMKQIQGNDPKNQWYLLEVDNPLVVPINKKIRFLVTSNDVIHSWWVPALGIKRDAIPGFIHEAWAVITKPGIYRGQCAELCGINHAYMPIVVVAMNDEDYQKWLAAHSKGLAAQQAANDAALKKDWSKAELMKAGENVYNSKCAACHRPDGKGMPPSFPALIGSKVATGPVNGHIEIVLNGKTGTAMQAFRNQLNDTDIAAVVTYERNAWANGKLVADNKQATLVQPKDVAALRGGKQ